MLPEQAHVQQQLEKFRREEPRIWPLMRWCEAQWQFTELSPLPHYPDGRDEGKPPSLAPRLRVSYECCSDRHFDYGLTLSVPMNAYLLREESGARLLQCAQWQADLRVWPKPRHPALPLPRIDASHYEAIGEQRLAQREAAVGTRIDSGLRQCVLALYVTQIKYASDDRMARALATPFRAKVADLLDRTLCHALFGESDEETARHLRSAPVYVLPEQEFVNGLQQQTTV
jgi:hypothetical protein